MGIKKPLYRTKAEEEYDKGIISPPVPYDEMPSREVMCLDMKSFYASVEAVERGFDPFTKMIAVVGDRERPGSVVLAASPPLKHKYHVGTGDRCRDLPREDDLLIVEPRMSLYIERSAAITELLTEFAPIDDIFTYSIDESWIDLTDVPPHDENPRCKARLIQRQIYDRFQLVTSMGLGPNMFIAKVAMDIEGKKTGLAHWDYEDIPRKLWPVKLSDCWGIGSRLEKKLNQKSLKKVGDLARLQEGTLERRLGKKGRQLYRHAWGIDYSQPGGLYDERTKSIGRGITLYESCYEEDELISIIYNLAEEIGFRARRQGLAGRTVSLSLSYSYRHPSSGFQAQRTEDQPFNLEGEIVRICRQLLRENYPGAPVRKVSVSLGNLQPAETIQLDFFSRRRKEYKLARTRDNIRRRHGPAALSFGRSLCRKQLSQRIKDNIGGHKA